MKRIITAAIAVPLALAATIYSPDWLFALFDAFLAGMMLEEYLGLSAARGHARPGRWFLIPGALVTAGFFAGAGWVITILVAACLCLMSASLFTGTNNDAFETAAVGLSGLVYCSVLSGFLVLIHIQGRTLLIVLFAIIWIGDSAAYYGGRALGRHPLAPRVSPKKTIEGAIAGLAGSAIAGTVAGVALLDVPAVKCLSIAVIVAIAGQIGDLAESALKRSAGVKDSSSVLPGHGGILDRLDSLLFAAPVFFWLLGV